MANALVLAVIAQFQQLHDRTKDQYTDGDCYRFHLLLKRVFPAAEPWYDETAGHVLTQIGDKLYDITGYVWSVRSAPPYVVRWADARPSARNTAHLWRWNPALRYVA